MTAASKVLAASTRCAVLGSPIAHSLSPELHSAAYAALGLTNWSYGRCEVTAAELPDFVASRDATWRGLSLTMPLKEVALSLGDADPLAALVGAANTLVFSPAGRHVYNTDVGGLVVALQQAGVTSVGSVVILGAGSTARSSLVSVARLGASMVTVVARDPAKAERLRPLAETLSIELSVRSWDGPLPPSELLVSTVTAGAVDHRADAVAASAPAIFDATYHPWPTPLAAAAEQAGRTVVNGLALLVAQAVLQVELMTGRTVSPDVLRTAGEAALRRSLTREQRSRTLPSR